MISLEQGVELVRYAFNEMSGGEIYAKKIPSMSILDIAKAVAPAAECKIISVLPGEKIHEQMIGLEDAPHTFAYADHYKILPMIHNCSNDPARIKDGTVAADDFTYNSGTNSEWMDVGALKAWIEVNWSKVGKI